MDTSLKTRYQLPPLACARRVVWRTRTVAPFINLSSNARVIGPQILVTMQAPPNLPPGTRFSPTAEPGA